MYSNVVDDDDVVLFMSTCWIFLDRANAVRVRQCWYPKSLIMTLTGRLLRLAKRRITGESEHSEGNSKCSNIT